MNKNIRVALSTLACVMFSAPAHAQDTHPQDAPAPAQNAQAQEITEVPPELESYVNLPAHNLTTGAIIGQQAAQLPPCKSDTARLSTISVFKKVKFDGSGRRPVDGVWKELWKVDGCEVSGFFNVLVAFAGINKMQVAPLPPGLSLAEPLLQKNASVHAATAAIKLAPPDCKSSRIIDTRFIGFVAPEGEPAKDPKDAAQQDAQDAPKAEGKPTFATRPTRSWREEWTVDVCGVSIITPLKFTPELTGISVTAIPEETHKK
jgi:hypothetical protein